MVRVVTVALALVFGMLLLSDLAHADGAATYAAKCKVCHGADGKGNAVMKVPAFVSPSKDTVLNGKGKMPSFKGKLTDAEADDVVSYIKTLK